MLLGENWCWSLLGPKGLRSWVLVRPRWSNPQPPSMHSSALPTELVLLRLPAKRTSAVQFWKRWLSGIETVSCKSEDFSLAICSKNCLNLYAFISSLQTIISGMGELHLEVYTEVWKRMVRNAFPAFPAFLVNKGSRLEAMVDRKHILFFFFICPLEPRPLAHPRPRVIVTAHWNGLWSAGLGSAGSTTTKTAKY